MQTGAPPARPTPFLSSVLPTTAAPLGPAPPPPAARQPPRASLIRAETRAGVPECIAVLNKPLTQPYSHLSKAFVS